MGDHSGPSWRRRDRAPRRRGGPSKGSRAGTRACGSGTRVPSSTPWRCSGSRRRWRGARGRGTSAPFRTVRRRRFSGPWTSFSTARSPRAAWPTPCSRPSPSAAPCSPPISRATARSWRTASPASPRLSPLCRPPPRHRHRPGFPGRAGHPRQRGPRAGDRGAPRAPAAIASPCRSRRSRMPCWRLPVPGAALLTARALTLAQGLAAAQDQMVPNFARGLELTGLDQLRVADITCVRLLLAPSSRRFTIANACTRRSGTWRQRSSRPSYGPDRSPRRRVRRHSLQPVTDSRVSRQGFTPLHLCFGNTCLEGDRSLDRGPWTCHI